MPSKPSKPFKRVPAPRRKAILAIAVACAAAAAMLIAARQPSPAEDQPRVETSIAAVQAAEPVAARPAPKPRASRPAVKPAAASVARTGSTAEPVTRPAVDPPVVASRTEAAPAAAAAAQGDPATIIGCLEFDDDRFRLKDTEGEDAPKARGWRSGFLRRSSATLDVVDTANRLRLSTHVGHRISLTGLLVDREMQARSVKMVADSCDD